MRNLLDFILEGLIGKDAYSIEEQEEDNFIKFNVFTIPDHIGIVIGKEGRTIKAIRNLLKVKATLEKKAVSISVSESPEAAKVS